MPASLSSGNVSLSALVGNTVFEPVSPSDFDLLETTTLSSSASSVTFSGLSTYATDYKHLQIRLVARDTANFGDRAIDIRINNDSGTNYSSHRLFGNGSSVNSNAYTSQTLLNNIGSITGDGAASGQFGVGVLDILDAFETTKNKTFRMISGHAGSTDLIFLNSGLYINTAAITSIQFLPDGGYVTGSRFSLYGIKAGA